MYITDLHNHTKFSYDGQNTPEEIIENAIKCGIDVIGITDHQFTVRGDLIEYFEYIQHCRIKYRDKIRVLCGLEIGTRPKPDDFLAKASRELDYVLFESLDHEKGMDLFEFLEWRRLFECPAGLAHTDIFALEERYGVDMIKIMKEHKLFWEINTSGNYIYYYDFLTNPEKRRRIEKSHIPVSIGSDTHMKEQLDIKKLIRINELVRNMQNPVFGSDKVGDEC